VPALIGELLAQGRVVRIEVTGHPPLWVNADRRAWFEPRLPSSDASMVDIVRAGSRAWSVSASAIAWSLGLPAAPVSAALAALEAEGFAMRGPIHARGCRARAAKRNVRAPLLARIHRYTVKRLRAEIERCRRRSPRFLFEWQRVLPNARLQGPDAVAGVLAQLEVSKRRRAPGRATCSRRGLPSTIRTGWTSTAARGVSSGPASSI